MVRDDEYVICPHCGEEHGDAWEWAASPDSHVVWCQKCAQPFSAWAEYSVMYVTSTRLPEPMHCRECGEHAGSEHNPICTSGDAPPRQPEDE